MTDPKTGFRDSEVTVVQRSMLLENLSPRCKDPTPTMLWFDSSNFLIVLVQPRSTVRFTQN